MKEAIPVAQIGVAKKATLAKTGSTINTALAHFPNFLLPLYLTKGLCESLWKSE